jgi:hypothetical protein
VTTSDAMPGPDQGRRSDRVLGPDYLAELGSRPLAEVRALRDEAEQEEADVSYLRRLLQGRIDIVRAELARRSEGGAASLLDALPQILSEHSSGPPRGLGRRPGVEPSRADAHRRSVEALVADVDLDDVGARSDDELRRGLEIYSAEEQTLSATRRAIHGVLDRCAAEIARRYRDGEADVSELLDREDLRG